MDQSHRAHMRAAGAGFAHAASLFPLAKIFRTLLRLYLKVVLFLIYVAYPMGLSLLRREKHELWATTALGCALSALLSFLFAYAVHKNRVFLAKLFSTSPQVVFGPRKQELLLTVTVVTFLVFHVLTGGFVDDTIHKYKYNGKEPRCKKQLADCRQELADLRQELADLKVLRAKDVALLGTLKGMSTEIREAKDRNRDLVRKNKELMDQAEKAGNDLVPIRTQLATCLQEQLHNSGNQGFKSEQTDSKDAPTGNATPAAPTDGSNSNNFVVVGVVIAAALWAGSRLMSWLESLSADHESVDPHVVSMPHVDPAQHAPVPVQHVPVQHAPPVASNALKDGSIPQDDLDACMTSMEDNYKELFKICNDAGYCRNTFQHLLNQATWNDECTQNKGHFLRLQQTSWTDPQGKPWPSMVALCSSPSAQLKTFLKNEGQTAPHKVEEARAKALNFFFVNRGY